MLLKYLALELIQRALRKGALKLLLLAVIIHNTRPAFVIAITILPTFKWIWQYFRSIKLLVSAHVDLLDNNHFYFSPTLYSDTRNKTGL